MGTAFFLLWAEVRGIAHNSIFSMLSDHIATHSMSISYSIGELLTRYEIFAEILARSSQPPFYVSTEPENISRYRDFCDTVNEASSPRPYRFYIKFQNISGCQMEYDETDLHKFNAFYYFPYNKTHDVIKKYSSGETDFSNFDRDKEGELIDYMPIENSDFRIYEDHQKPSWSTALPVFGGQTEPRVYSAFFPVENNGVKIVGCAALRVPDLWNMLKSRTLPSYAHFLVFDNSGNVIIENSLGAVMPINYTSTHPLYPTISELGKDLWNDILTDINITELGIDTVNISEKSGRQIMLMKRVIYTRYVLSFYEVLAYELDPVIENIFTLLTIAFISCVAAIGFSLVIIGMIYGRFIKRYRRKLKRKVRVDSIDPSFESHPYIGGTGNAINRLRKFQMRCSDEVVLNKILDSAVNEISGCCECLFGVQTNDTKCEFCKYLRSNHNDNNHYYNNQIIKALKTLQNQKTFENQNTMNTLNNMSNLHYCILNNPNSFNNFENLKKKEVHFQESLKSAQRRTSRGFLHLNKNGKTQKMKNRTSKIRKEIPFSNWSVLMNDSLFAYDEYNCHNDPKRYIIKRFGWILKNGNLLFPNLDPDRLLFFVYHFVTEYVDKPNFKAEGLGILHNLLKGTFESILPNKENILALLLAFLLRNSKIKELNELFPIISAYFPLESCSNFIDLVFLLFNGTKNSEIMKVYGEFYNGIKSASFDTEKNDNDEIILLKAFLIFSDFSPYISDYHESTFQEINHFIFNDDEINNKKLIGQFHLEVAQNIVRPWIKMLSLIVNLNCELYIDGITEFWNGYLKMNV
ncbi:hypothetical protein TRFO_35640 [Tritrichomonas foetus]|uniref:Uncharacterized protein n=1 Tax=Tritrichomonas foetus TaxID=1144522 RepID=A0A1J4JFV3_9EUKA|nr:hypothetical protein TRFO_35640 [Tritrichomonas foetus]|eukprot:OHS98034.1 hypothetical protein TRFO_35640 [Tritrichomonas foetus]